MKKALNALVVVAALAVVAFAANVENPLYGPAPLGFYSKTGFGWMYKKGDDNLAMTAKGWDGKVETKIFRIYEDFGLGLTDRFALRGAFGYTHDADIDRSGPHNARLGLNYRAINAPTEAVVWDLYMDAWLGGISKMKAELIKSNPKPENAAVFAEQPLSFQYENYANGRWGLWVGTQVGKTFDKLTLSVFGELQQTFGNNNNEIKINENAKPIIQGMVTQTLVAKGLPEALATGVANIYAPLSSSSGGALPDDFNVDTDNTKDYAAGLKTLYEINKDWSIGGGFSWRHRGANSIEALNIGTKDVDAQLGTLFDNVGQSVLINQINTKSLTQGIADSFVGPMDDGIDEFYISLLGSRQITKNLQLTLFGEYTFDSAEEKSQLGTDAKFEVGLRMNWQF